MKKRKLWVVEVANEGKENWEPLAHRCFYCKRAATLDIESPIITYGELKFRVQKYEAVK